MREGADRIDAGLPLGAFGALSLGPVPTALPFRVRCAPGRERVRVPQLIGLLAVGAATAALLPFAVSRDGFASPFG